MDTTYTNAANFAAELRIQSGDSESAARFYRCYPAHGNAEDAREQAQLLRLAAYSWERRVA